MDARELRIFNQRIFVAGHRGMVGRAVCRALEGAPYIITRTRQELDLLDRQSVRAFFDLVRPSVVIDAAALVGGIEANRRRPVDFLLQNLMIQNNLIEAAADFEVEQFLFLGSSCIYPKHAPQPISEDALLGGPLEPTNEAYAVAKIAGIKLCQAYREQFGKNFISAMPTNLYGPFDNFDLNSSHVLPALIRKMHDAKAAGATAVQLWGTGTPRREFLHCDDLASACLYLLEHYSGMEIVNIGCGEDLPIRELAEVVAGIVGFEGKVEFDAQRPDGTPRKLLQTKIINDLGWKPAIDLEEGIAATYRWYLSSQGDNLLK